MLTMCELGIFLEANMPESQRHAVGFVFMNMPRGFGAARVEGHMQYM